MRGVLDEAGLLIPAELLMLVLLYPLFKVAWYSWEVVESWSVNPVLILASNDQWS